MKLRSWEPEVLGTGSQEPGSGHQELRAGSREPWELGVRILKSLEP